MSIQAEMATGVNHGINRKLNGICGTSKCDVTYCWTWLSTAIVIRHTVLFCRTLKWSSNRA